MASVHAILAASPGTVPVTLEIRRPGQFAARVKVDHRLSVRPTPRLTRELGELLGPKAVRYLTAFS